MNGKLKFAYVAAGCLTFVGLQQVLAQQTLPGPPPSGPGAMSPLGVPTSAIFGMGDAVDLYTSKCSSCHGTDLSGGRGPSLFNPAFLAERTDEQLRATILAGIRVATVTTIGTATIAAAIGGGGLGVFIFRGVASVYTAQILAGAVPAALIALVADGGLGWVERKLSRA